MPKQKRAPVGVAGVFDIETQDWTTYVLGGVLTERGYWQTRDPDALAARILQIRGDVWAHNGGRYDALWLLDVLARWGVPDVRVSCAGARITMIEIGETRIRDSYALIPMSLAAAAPLGGMVKSETGLPCKCGRACGGYCRIRVGMPEVDYAKVGEYLENDCRATWAMLRAVAGWLETHGCVMRGTIGATAYASAASELGIGKAIWTRGTYTVARSGYYGGRVEVFQPVAANGHRYDRNSSYPAALVETALPVGRPVVMARAAGAYADGREGVYRATVDVPDSTFVPPLPVRLPDGLVYPVGRLDGSWTGLELRAAEECGARIVAIRDGLVWHESERLFAPWCRRIWELRAAAPPVWAKWIKWLSNATTGKLAQKPDQTEVLFGPEPAKGGWEPMGPSRRIWTRDVWKIPGCGHVQHAAYLTASARVELLRQLRLAGTAAIYCDTDSVYATRELDRRIGRDLGEWKYEGAMREWRAWAPKLYRYRATDGKGHVAAKGLPGLTFDDAPAFANGVPWVDDRGVAGLATAAQDGGSLFRRRRIVRTCHADGEWFGSRRLGRADPTRTYPVTLDSLIKSCLDETVPIGGDDE